MTQLTHLLDTSAWLAHVFNEPGGNEITVLFEAPDIKLSISALSLLEAHTRFRTLGRASEFDEMLTAYRPLFERILSIDEAVALRAIALREAATSRVPAIDALIAATAAHHNAILVHRDPHFGALPVEGIAQLALGGDQGQAR